MELVQETIHLPIDRARLAGVRSSLRQLCLDNGVDPETTRRVILAIDEAISNVMEHSLAYEDSEVQVSLEFSEETIVAEIRDRGLEFDPSWRRIGPSWEVSGNAPVGRTMRKHFKRGFGLYLIHLVSDKVEYQRTEAGENVLTLTVNGG